MKMIATTIKLACISPSVSTPAQSVQTENFSIPKYERKEREREREERKTINQVVYQTFGSTLKTFFGSMLMGKHFAREKK